MKILEILGKIIQKFFKSEAPVYTNFRILPNSLSDGYVNKQAPFDV